MSSAVFSAGIGFPDAPNYVGGRPIGVNGPHLDVHDPSTGEVIAHVPLSTRAEVDAAVTAAQAAFPSWAATPIKERVQVFFRYKALLERHLVMPDAERESTAANIVASMAGSAGQRCMAASVIVAVSATDHIVTRMVEVARAIVPGTDIGPVISAEAKARIVRYIDEAEAAGARVLVDGRRAVVPGREGGYFLGPTGHRRGYARDADCARGGVRAGATGRGLIELWTQTKKITTKWSTTGR